MKWFLACYIVMDRVSRLQVLFFPSYQLQGAVTSVKEVSGGPEVSTSSMVQAEAYSQVGDTWWGYVV